MAAPFLSLITIATAAVAAITLTAPPVASHALAYLGNDRCIGKTLGNLCCDLHWSCFPANAFAFAAVWQLNSNLFVAFFCRPQDKEHAFS